MKIGDLFHYRFTCGTLIDIGIILRIDGEDETVYAYFFGEKRQDWVPQYIAEDIVSHVRFETLSHSVINCPRK